MDMQPANITITRTYSITLLEENMLNLIEKATGRKKSKSVREGIAIVFNNLCTCLEREGDSNNCPIHSVMKS